MKVGDRHYRSLWADRPRGPVHIIDQTKLPHAFETRSLRIDRPWLTVFVVTGVVYLLGTVAKKLHRPRPASS